MNYSAQKMNDLQELESLMRQYPAQAYALALNKKESLVLATLKLKDLDSAKLARALGITVQATGGLLHRLWEKGVCGRRLELQPSGGHYYVYFNVY